MCQSSRKQKGKGQYLEKEPDGWFGPLRCETLRWTEGHAESSCVSGALGV